MAPESSHPAVLPKPPVAGSAASLSEGAILLPDFVTRDADGVRVVPDVPGRAAQMQRFVERVFTSGAYFVGLDYDALSSLLYGPEGRDAGGGKVLRIADGIEFFDPERRDLYKAPKSVDFVASLPRSPVGKVLKKDLRQQYWQAAQRKI